MKKIIFTIFSGLFITQSLSQSGFPPPVATNASQAITNSNAAWYRGGNYPSGPAGSANIFGTRWPSNIYVMTENVVTCEFTRGGQLNSWSSNSGDGLRIRDLSNSGANHLDLFTSFNNGGNETHAKFGGSGQVSGQNNRFEFIATGASQGNYYSTFANSGIHRFDRGQTEYGRLGTNNFWRFGENNSGPYTGGVSAARQVEVVDDAIQFRLTYSPNSTGLFTDFFSNSFGNLQILPIGGKVGINLSSDPTANLDVNGNARIRNAQSAVPDALFVGVQNGGNPADLNVRRLDFTGNSNQVLLGNGTWGTAPSTIGTCANPTVLTTTGAIDLNNKNFYFLGNGTQNGNLVNIGYNCSSPNNYPLWAKLNVLQTGYTTNQFNAAQYVIAGSFIADGNAWPNSGSIGLFSYATGPNTNYGIYADAVGGSTNYAGYFDGPIYVNGTIIGSDLNLKQNINSISNALSIINQLKPKTFEYKHNDFPSMNLPQGTQFGLIAQEVETVLPELVSDNVHPATLDSLGNILIPEVQFKGLEYQELVPILIKGIQEQQQHIQDKDSLINNLNFRLTQLENCLSALLPTLCQLNQSIIQSNNPSKQAEVRQQLTVMLSNKEAIVLDQNVPNPFAEQTVINFSIPATVVKAQIHFYNAEGKLMQTVDVQERGLGSLTVFGSDLSKGVYTYSLVADGQVVATKRMMKQ